MLLSFSSRPDIVGVAASESFRNRTGSLSSKPDVRNGLVAQRAPTRLLVVLKHVRTDKYAGRTAVGERSPRHCVHAF